MTQPVPSNLPDHAPSRTVRPGDWPSPKAVRDRLDRIGMDATSLPELMHFIGEQGWIWRLAGGPNFPRCWGAIIVPWVSMEPWAEGWGNGPAEALSLALVLAMGTWPPERSGNAGPPEPFARDQ